MRRIAFAFLLLLLCVPSGWPSHAVADAPQNEPVRDEQLREDLELLARLRALELSPGLAEAALLRPLDGYRREEPSSLGFGGSYSRLIESAGHVRVDVESVRFESQVTVVKISVRSDTALLDRFAAVLGPDYFRTRGPWGPEYLQRRWTDPEGLARQQRAVDAELGAAPVLDVPEHLRHIIASKRADLLRLVLRGLNPEGRVYAAQALLAQATAGSPLTDADRTAIQKVRSSDVLVSTCEGCIYDAKKAAELLAAP